MKSTVRLVILLAFVLLACSTPQRPYVRFESDLVEPDVQGTLRERGRLAHTPDRFELELENVDVAYVTQLQGAIEIAEELNVQLDKSPGSAMWQQKLDEARVALSRLIRHSIGRNSIRVVREVSPPPLPDNPI